MGSKHSRGPGGGLTKASAGADGLVPSSSGFLLGGLFLAAGEAGGVRALLRATSALDAIGFAAQSWSVAPARCPGCAAVSFSQPAGPKAQHEAAGTWLPLGHTTVSSPLLTHPSHRAGWRWVRPC